MHDATTRKMNWFKEKLGRIWRRGGAPLGQIYWHAGRRGEKKKKKNVIVSRKGKQGGGEKEDLGQRIQAREMTQ